MNKNPIAKILSLALLATLLLSVVIFSSSATDEGSGEILAQSIVHKDKISIAFALDATADEILSGRVTLCYSVDGGEEKVAALYTDGSYNGSPVLVTDGFSAQYIGKSVNAVLYRDGAAVDTVSYSVLEFLYAKLYRDGFDTSEDEKIIPYAELYRSLLDYAERARQIFAQTEPSFYSYSGVKIVGGTLSGDSYILLQNGEALALGNITKSFAEPIADITVAGEDTVPKNHRDTLTVTEHLTLTLNPSYSAVGEFYSSGLDGLRLSFSDGVLPSELIMINSKGTVPTTLSILTDNGRDKKLLETGLGFHGFAISPTDTSTVYTTGTYVFEAAVTVTEAAYRLDGNAMFAGFIMAGGNTDNNSAFTDVYVKVPEDKSTFTWFGKELSVGTEYILRAEYDIETDTTYAYVNGELAAYGEFANNSTTKNNDDTRLGGFFFYPRVSGMCFTLDNIFLGHTDMNKTLTDTEYLNAKWELLEKNIPYENASEIVTALKDMYSGFEPELVDWLAGLYDPTVGGFYYSQGARDNATVTYQGVTYDLLPDIESTAQALGFLQISGMIDTLSSSYGDVLPEEMKAQIIHFIKSLQNENGYFYHPQWGVELTDTKTSRRSRDLGNAVTVLHRLGSAPTYDTPTGVPGDGLLADGTPVSSVTPTAVRLGASVKAQAARVVAASSATAFDPRVENETAFREYLATLNIQTDSYSVGNTLTAFTNEIIARDEALKAEGADYSLCDILIEWLNANQFDNGLWHAETNYYGVNGLMKISGVYGKIGVLLPNSKKAAEAAVAAITSDEVPTAVTSVYNTWYAAERVLRHMRTYGNDTDKANADEVFAALVAEAPEGIRKTAEKLEVFKKESGSYSYTKDYSSARSQGMPVTLDGMAEGDVNATVICTSDVISYIYSALCISDYKVPIYTLEDYQRFVYLINQSIENAN